MASQSISAWIGFVFWPEVEALAEMMEEDAIDRVRGPTSPPWGPSRLSLGQDT